MAGRLFADGGYELGKRPRLMGDQGGMFFEGGGGMGGLGPLGFGGSPHLAAMAAMAPNLSMLSGHGPRLFPVVKLRGLPFNCTDSDVIDFFFGLDVVDVLMLRKGSRFCGEAFVVFGAPVQIDYALQKNRQNMGRRYIEVFRAKKAEYYAAIANEVALGPPEEAADAPPSERPDRRRLNSMAIVPSGSRVNQEKVPGEPTSVLKMRGLPFSVTKQDIIEFFDGFALADDSIHIVVSAEGRPKGEAFVEFSSPADAQSAMDKDKMLLGKRYVELFYSSRDEATKAARPL